MRVFYDIVSFITETTLKQNSHLFSRQVSHDPNHVFLNLRQTGRLEDWKTGANGGPKWRQILMSSNNYKKKIAFYLDQKIFRKRSSGEMQN